MRNSSAQAFMTDSGDSTRCGPDSPLTNTHTHTHTHTHTPPFIKCFIWRRQHQVRPGLAPEAPPPPRRRRFIWRRQQVRPRLPPEEPTHTTGVYKVLYWAATAPGAAQIPPLTNPRKTFCGHQEVETERRHHPAPPPPTPSSQQAGKAGMCATPERPGSAPGEKTGPAVVRKARKAMREVMLVI